MRTAMAVQMVICPASAATDRRTPKWGTEDAPNDAAGNGTYGASDDEASPGARRGTHPIGARARRSDGESGKDSNGQSNITHVSLPPRICRTIAEQPFHKVDAVYFLMVYGL